MQIPTREEKHTQKNIFQFKNGWSLLVRALPAGGRVHVLVLIESGKKGIGKSLQRQRLQVFVVSAILR